MHGSGYQVWSDGTRYDGEYVNDLREGYGMMVKKSGQRYVGFW